MSELTSYWPDPDFLEAVADEVHALFFPPAPPANMERFKRMVSAAIDQQNHHARAEADRERKATDHYKKVKQDRRLRNEKAGPPKEGWVWDEGFLTGEDPEAEPLGAWVPPKLAPRMGLPQDEPIPAWHELQPTPPEIILPGQNVILAIVHDNSDAATNRGRPRLLEGFNLPPAFALMRKIGPGTPNEMRMSGFDRKSIERALRDVKADLALVESPVADDVWLPVRNLAEHFDVPLEALRKRLDRCRWRNRGDSDLYTESYDRGHKDPQYLYRVGRVRSIIEALQADVASAKRPS